MLDGVLGLMRGIRSLPLGWQMWVHSLAGVNMVLPLFFWGRPEATWTLAAFAAGFFTGALLVRRQGFTRLLGLMHVFWLPLLVWLWGRLLLVPADEPFGLWMRVLFLMNASSLLIDAVDVVRYLRGERKPVARAQGQAGLL
jgi:hypothetical protein